MTKRMGGARRKTRYKFQKSAKDKGKMSLVKYFQSFKEGDKVVLLSEPSVHNGMYHRRFHGKSGIISGSRGACYFVKIKDGGKEKELIIHPVHLKRM
jgi:large subunit ribosomal protein L21e